MASLIDDKMAFWRTATGLNLSAHDMERAYWLIKAGQSLTSNLSLRDAMSLALPGTGSLRDRYYAWLATFTAGNIPGSIADREKALFAAGGPVSGFQLTGSGGNSEFFVNDSVANSITGDIEIQARVNPTTWNANGCLVGKRNTLIAYEFFIITGKFLFLRTSPDGTTQATATSSSAVPFADGTPGWVRVVRVAATGVVTFSTAPDGSSPSFSNLGIAQGTTAGGISDTADKLEIGNDLDNGGSPFIGYVQEVHLKGVIGGADVENLVYPSLSSVSGATWTKR